MNGTIQCVRPIDFERNGSKILGEVKKPAYQDESDWSILNWLNRRYSNVSARVIGACIGM